MASLNKKSKQSKKNMQSTGTSGVIRQSQTNNSALNVASSNNNNEIIISQNNNSKEISCDEMLTLGKSKIFPKI